jgi:hypothetical protein
MHRVSFRYRSSVVIASHVPNRRKARVIAALILVTLNALALIWLLVKWQF